MTLHSFVGETIVRTVQHETVQMGLAEDAASCTDDTIVNVIILR